jgi:mycofactocin system glycosyltransferase
VAYEAARSPLDLGSDPAPVRPGSKVGYVPSAAVLVRRSALEGVGGFDEDLASGEDVDLVWRLVADGGRVRYDPSVVVDHPARADLWAWAAQRFSYGRSAAPLAARHGRAVAPLQLTPATAAAWSLAALGRPAAGLALAGGTVAGAASRGGRDVVGPILAAAVGAQARAGAAVARALWREWWPFTVATSLLSPKSRRAALAAALVPPLRAWRATRPDVGAVTWTALWLLDGVAYGAGVWAGAAARGQVTCLLPAGPAGARVAPPAGTPG